jgi:hypothetical protein
MNKSLLHRAVHTFLYYFSYFYLRLAFIFKSFAKKPEKGGLSIYSVIKKKKKHQIISM